jgi:hypothetical protein
MSGLTRALVVVVAGALLGCIGTETAAQPDGWGTRADAAIDRAIALDTGSNRVFYDAFLASAIAMRSPNGWHDPRALDYLHRVIAQRHPDGGFGLNYAWDAFNDGTRNPVSTTYTVTLADHVGKMFLEAHAAGVLNRYYIDTLLTKLQTIPRIPVAGGYCWAYSDHPNDVKPGYCSHNVNAGVGAFLSMAREAGFTAASQWSIMEIARYETLTYRNWDRSWRYVDFRPGLNPADHNAYNVESMMQIAPGVGDAALVWMMSRTLGLGSAEAHARLAKFDCAGSLRWLPEFDARMAEPAVAGSLDRQAYVARLAAQAAEVCEA